MVKKIFYYFKMQQNNSMELIWANIWHDTIKGIDWLNNSFSISPGRMAVGYNYLYVMTRILDDIRPKCILDIGLGVSSTLISRYMEYYGDENYEHTIIEHDKEWSNFYLRKHKISNFANIIFLKRIYKMMKGKKYYAYEGVKETLLGRKYSVISIDAPKGGKRYKYARRDILELLPDILEESWVILIDDAERAGEKMTIRDIEKILFNNNISYTKGWYSGTTHVCVIASSDNSFLCTL